MTALAPALPTPRLTGAEILKLRKRRGLLTTVGLMTVGASVVFYAILALLHWANPAHHGPAGGVNNLGHGLVVLGLLGAVAAGLVGATTGAGDLSAGVFRELVVTGRSRWALYLSRIPGGLLFLLPLVAFGFALASLGSVVFAGWLPAPSASLLAESGGWLLLDVTFYYLLALGLASVIGSRTTSIAVMLAWRLALTPLLLAISFLGVIRELVPGAAIARIAPQAYGDAIRQGPQVPMSVAAAVAVLAVWALIAVVLGGWRTATRDA
jgi:ABC-type transport system involved in multi-copper enzyme maturation permease subunit